MFYFIPLPFKSYIKNEFSIITFSIAMKYLHFHQASSVNREVNGRKMSNGIERELWVDSDYLQYWRNSHQSALNFPRVVPSIWLLEIFELIGDWSSAEEVAGRSTFRRRNQLKTSRNSLELTLNCFSTTRKESSPDYWTTKYRSSKLPQSHSIYKPEHRQTTLKAFRVWISIWRSIYDLSVTSRFSPSNIRQ